MEHPYSDFKLIRLSSIEKAVFFDDQFIMIDNFDVDSEDEESFFVNYPIKISFIIAIFCLEGNMHVQLNLQEIEVKKNDFLIVREGSIGEYKGMSADTRIAILAFNPDFFQSVDDVASTLSLERQLYKSPLIHLMEDAMNECMIIYNLMKAKIGETENPFRKGALIGYMQVLTNCAYNYVLARESLKIKETTTRHQELYMRFIEEVQIHYTKERSISFYANLLCVTPKYLSQMVRKASSRLAGDWIKDFVILEAKAMLKSHKYSIQQISNHLNFANQSFFSKYFKAEVGCTPSEYQHD